MHNVGYYCYLNLFEGVSTSGSLSVHVQDTVCPVGPYFQPYQVETHTHKIVPAAVGALPIEGERESNQRCADYAMVWPIVGPSEQGRDTPFRGQHSEKQQEITWTVLWHPQSNAMVVCFLSSMRWIRTLQSILELVRSTYCNSSSFFLSPRESGLDRA